MEHAKHTPLPLIAANDHPDPECGDIWYIRREGETRASCRQLICLYDDPGGKMAKFSALACNAHYGLLAVAELAVEVADGSLVELARAAIAKATA